MLDSLVGTILTDARTVLDDLDPFLLELEVSAERADAALLSTIYNTTPLLSNGFTLLGLTDAVALVDLLQLVTGAFRSKTLSLSYVTIREVVRGFSALIAFLDSADSEKISKANNALRELIKETWPTETEAMLTPHSLCDPFGNKAFAVSGHVLSSEFIQECSCYVLELDESGVLAGTQFTPFSLLQFLYKSGQVLDVRFAPPQSKAYLQVLYATVLDAEQLQMVLDIPQEAIFTISTSSFSSDSPAWSASESHLEKDEFVAQPFEKDNDEVPLTEPSADLSIEQKATESLSLPLDSEEPQSVSSTMATSSAVDKFALLEAELEGELFEEALTAGIEARSLDKAKQELPEKVASVSESRAEQPEESEAVVAEAPVDEASRIDSPVDSVEELHGFSCERTDRDVTLYVSSIADIVEAERLRAALLELLSCHLDIELVLEAPISGNLEVLQLLLSAAMTAGLRRQAFRVSGEGKESVAVLLAGCGITLDVLKAQGIADFLE